VQVGALRDQDLRADQVHAGDHLGDGVLDLNARVDFDEEPIFSISVDQELDRAGVDIAGLAGQPHGRRAELAAQLLADV